MEDRKKPGAKRADYIFEDIQEKLIHILANAKNSDIVRREVKLLLTDIDDFKIELLHRFHHNKGDLLNVLFEKEDDNDNT